MIDETQTKLPEALQDTLTTERLVLRQLKNSDALALSKYGSDFDIARMTGSFPHPFPLLSAEFKIMHLKSMQRRGLAYPYVITVKGSDELIGIVDLFRKNVEDTLEIGYWVARPFWGQGYAAEAGETLLREADMHLDTSTVHAGVFADNPASLRVLEKLGFKPTGERDMYFSTARMEKAESVLLKRSFA